MDPEPNLYFFAFQTIVAEPSGSLLPLLITFILLLICSGMISASEVAYFSLGLKDIKVLEEENTPSSLRAINLKEKPRYLLATILISNNFVNVATVIVAVQILRFWIGENTLIDIGTWLHNNVLYGVY